MHVDVEVKVIVGRQLGIDPAALNENMKLNEDLGADSLDYVEILFAVEEHFDIALPDELTEYSDPGFCAGRRQGLKTVGELVELTKQQILIGKAQAAIREGRAAIREARRP